MNTLCALLLLFPLTAAAVEPLPDAPKPHHARVEPFLANKLNRALVISDFSARMMDAVSTHAFLTDSCNCFMEKGTFYGTFSMRPIAESNAGMYLYSAGMAAAFSLASGYLWTRGQHSHHHQKLYKFAARAVLAYDIQSEARFDVNNWVLISNGRTPSLGRRP